MKPTSLQGSLQRHVEQPLLSTKYPLSGHFTGHPLLGHCVTGMIQIHGD